MNWLIDDVYLRIINNENDEEENEEFLLENCSKVFHRRNVEEGYEFYLNQYQRLFIKSILISYENCSFLFLIRLIPFVINLYVNQVNENSLIEYSFDNWNHLQENYIYVLSSHRSMFNSFKSSLQKHFPLTKFIYLSNMSHFNQLKDFLWGKKRIFRLRNKIDVIE